MYILIGAAVIAVAIGGIVTSLAVIFARRVVLPRRSKRIRVYAVCGDQVELDSNAKTTQQGEFGLWFDDGSHLRVGAVRQLDISTGHVRREVVAVTGSSPEPGTGRWTGHVFPGPEAIDPRVREILIGVDGGNAPAWLFHPDHADGETWAVHVHGIRTTRITALRSVPLAQEQGYISIVPSFRGDGEGPQTPRGASMLGQTEWCDVEGALEYAVDHGAKTIILFGWSMGAQIALQLTERSAYRDRIAGLVLIAPVTDWRQVIRNGARRANLPVSLAHLAEWALGDPFLSKIVGVSSSINLDDLDWGMVRRVSRPSLVLHSIGDEEVPFSATMRFEEANRGHVEVAVFPETGHAWEYNLDPARFHKLISDWLSRTIIPYD